MDDRVLALCEISNDLLYHKIPTERLAYYVDQSLAFGSSAAAELEGQDLSSLYKENKIDIIYKDDGGSAFGVTYRGLIRLSQNGCELEMFRSSVKSLAENSGDGNLPPIPYELAERIHLAHEFFHFWEYKKNLFVSQALDPVVVFSILGMKRRAHINRCSEVAAHAFAKEFLGLPVLPNYYDYLYLINTGALSREGFQARLDHCAQIC